MATKATRAAVLDLLGRAGDYPDLDAFTDALVDAVLSGGDDGTRWCVVTQDPGMPPVIHGPYASASTAMRAIDTGALATREGARGHVYAISRAPRPKTTRRASSG